MTALQRAVCIALSCLIALIFSSLRIEGTGWAEKRAGQRADDYLARGLAHYKARRFERAIIAFRAGYRIDARREFLFALAQAERRSGDCASAMVYYRRFLATKPPGTQERAARNHYVACKRALSGGPALQRSSLSPVKKSTLAPSSPWYQDTAGSVLLGLGTVSVVVSLGFFSAAESAEDRAEVATTYPDYDVHLSRARRHRDWGLVALLSGAGLVSTAVVRLVKRRSLAALEAENRSLDTSSWMIASGQDGITVTYGGRF